MHSSELSNNIISSFRKGTPNALQSLIKVYYNPLRLFADRLLKDPVVAEDIVLESFTKLWNRRCDFEHVQNIKAFLYIAVRNASLNYLKQQKRETLSKKQLSYITGEKEDFVLNEIIRAEVLQEIMLAIERLPEQCGKVLRLGYFEGLKNQEIADLLHISVHTVKNQKARAIQLLKVRLRDRDLMAFVFLCSLFTTTSTD
jgi:RNA polymerase sigma-70 factor (family 1)